MSLRIIKAGLFDTIQDMGRKGYQHLGINPGGCMDRYAAALANALLGKAQTAALIEIHFPAATMQFEVSTMICISGADFIPTINEREVLLNQQVQIDKNDVLSFRGYRNGSRCYVAIFHDLKVEQWLGSFSTNVKAGAGGFNGRALKKDDVVEFEDIHGEMNEAFSYKVKPISSNQQHIRFIRGNEFDWIDEASKEVLLLNRFTITKNSDRMGYRLSGSPLQKKIKNEMVSSPVAFGTIQLLPDGQLIVLMADHQTTGGYPRLGTVISVDLSRLAQMKPGDDFTFAETSIEEAEKLFIDQQHYLEQIKVLCKQRIHHA